MIGKTIGKYRIIERLGRGGMGTVYKALDETLDREVAVKVLNPDLSESDVMKRFRKEAMTLAKLHHPDIATIHEVYQSDAELLMVMELVRGETFDQLLQRCGPLPAERAAYLVAQVLGALDHAHRAGVVHRDLKPANVMVTERGGIKILDFGIAYVEGAEHMTSDGFMVGTPAYMAPERVTGREVDARADLYSVGVLFYRLLTGQLPFKADTAVDMVQKLLSQEPTAAHVYRPDLPAWCEAILDRALAKAPTDRFQTAEAFRAALVAAINTTTNEETGLFSVGEVGAELPVALPDSPVPTPSGPAQIPVPMSASPAMASRAPSVADAVLTPPPARATPVPLAPASSTSPPVPPAIAASSTALDATLLVSASEAPDPVATPAPSARLPLPELAAAPSGVSSAPLPSGIAPIPAPAGTSPAIPAPVAASARMASAGTTLVMPRKQFAIAGVILGGLAIAVVILAVVALRRPGSTVPMGGTDAATTTTATTLPEPTPAAPSATAATDKPPAPAPAPPMELSEPPIKTSPEAAAPALPATPAPARRDPAGTKPLPARPLDTMPPLKFDAKAVVSDGDKRRERDASVVVADGTVTVLQNSDRVLYSIPVLSITALTYSNSKQPLWNSPKGPAEAMRVESGAFGFLKGERNWFGIQTKESLLVLRVDDEAVARVIAGLQDRTGLTLERLVEPKD
jgi:serine/threonine-protein kinase